MSSADVDAYLVALDDGEREVLEDLRRLILETVPSAEQVISYRVPAFQLAGTTIAGFAAFSKHLSYLPFSGSVLPALAADLTGYTRTKSSLHFSAAEPLPRELVEKLIAMRLTQAGLA